MDCSGGCRIRSRALELRGGDGNGNGSGGDGGSGGSGGGLWSSSTGVEPTPDGAWSLSFVQQSALERDIASHDAEVGTVTADTRTKVVTDGTEGAAVSCEVKGFGPFAVHGKVAQAGLSLEISIPVITPDASEQAPAEGQIACASVKDTVSDLYVSTAPCQLFFTPGTKQTVAEGKVWVTFTCSEVSHNDSTCEIEQSVAILENCATQ